MAIQNKMDFIKEEPETLTEKDYKLSSLARMSPKMLAQSIIEVYQRLGGVEWLLLQAESEPKAFFELLKKVMPTNIQVDGLDNMSISLVNAYVDNSQNANILQNTDVIDLEDRRKGVPLLTIDPQNKDEYEKLKMFESGQIATGGNPTEALTPSPTEDVAPPPGVVLRETYSPAAAGGNQLPDFNFE